MKNRDITSLGSVCAFLSAVLLPVSAISYMLMPPAQQSWADPAAFLFSFAESPTFAMIEYSANLLGAILALAVVGAVAHILRPVHEGWLRWATTIAIVGYSVNAVQYLRYLSLLPSMAERFLVADLPTRAATAGTIYVVPLDLYGWVTYGAFGMWALVVNILALQAKRWPPLLSYVGIGGGIAYWLVVVGYALHINLLNTVAAAAGVVLGPIWLLWMGIVLRRSTV